MTGRTIEEPSVIDQFVGHARAIVDGKRASPRRAVLVLVEFYDGNNASVISYGVSNDASSAEHLALALAAMNVLTGAACDLNADASN